jgi:hypothetical protein
MSRLSPTIAEELAQDRGTIEEARDALAAVRDARVPGSVLYVDLDQAVHACDEALRDLR